jgi:hypothetical protein
MAGTEDKPSLPETIATNLGPEAEVAAGAEEQDFVLERDAVVDEHESHKKEDEISIAQSRASTSSDNSSTDPGEVSSKAYQTPSLSQEHNDEAS